MADAPTERHDPRAALHRLWHAVPRDVRVLNEADYETVAAALAAEATDPPADDEPVAAHLLIVLALADSDPLVRPDEATSRWCVICGAEAPGGADTLPVSQHDASCVWVRARTEVERLHKEANGG